MYPANKLKIEDVRLSFKSNGCFLLDDVYTDSKTPLEFVCSCGEFGFKSYSKFKSSPRCKLCGYKSTGEKNRLTFEFVQSDLLSLGITLLSRSYISNATKLSIICKCGKEAEMTYASIKIGSECPTCRGITAWDIESISRAFSDRGCVFLEKDEDRIKYICKCGSTTYTTFGNFYYKSAGCRACGIEKISGKNAHQYRHDLSDEDRMNSRRSPEFKIWRSSVFERDNYRCQVCSCVGGKLNAHHLNGFAGFPEQAFDVDNGVTLCESCHHDFHKIRGYRTIATKSQFLEFKDNING